METVEPEAPPQRDEAERGMDAGVARGDGAHLLEVNEGVEAVLSARCEAAWSTHLPAGAVRTFGSSGVKSEGPYDPI